MVLLKTKKILFSLMGTIIVALLALLSLTGGKLAARAATADEEVDSEYITVTSEEGSTYGLGTSLSISLDGGNGKVWTTVRNDFTFLPSTVSVVVQLYCSDTYQEDYHDMELVAFNSITDLDMGKTIVAEASTEGQVKFWMGRMRFRIDSQSWKEDTVGPAKCNANGDYIGLT